MSIPPHHSTLAVSSIDSGSSDQARTLTLNLAYPTRPTLYSPWACPPKPLVIIPTICDRYEATFIHSNGMSGLAGHNLQSSVPLGSFEHDTLKWVKRIFSRYVLRLRRKIKLAKARLSVALWRHQN